MSNNATQTTSLKAVRGIIINKFHNKQSLKLGARVNTSLRASLLVAVLFWMPAATVFAAGSVVQQGNTIKNNEWGVSVTAPGIELWKDYPHQKSPAYILAAQIKNAQCKINISVQATSMPIGATALNCWKASPHSPDNLKRTRKTSQGYVTIHSAALRPVPHSLYDMVVEIKERKLTNNQLWTYQDREDQCIVLHASSINCAEFSQIAKPLMTAVQIDSKKDVTVETVSIGRQVKIASDSVQAHLLAAGYYLHQVKPAKPAKARRFYQSAYRLRKDKSDIFQQWIISEGVGLSFLLEEKAQQAVRSLEKALKLARQGGNRKNKMLGSTLYNLACAHSLNHNPKQACTLLTELVGVKAPDTHADLLKKIKTDPQLANTRSAACYRSVEALLK